MQLFLLATVVFLAPIGAENPETRKLIFPARKERPKEAPFVTWKNSFLGEDLEWKAGLAS
ncbi:hypothetical protein ACI6PS_13585 [Flavobacterium sp. PLA-1-15]|uniref:hypothetical protein n=1 Tax=Flavobacterium sp. PLA-1-15 TaxID=3380533 RepID=UPI003B7D8C38